MPEINVSQYNSRRVYRPSRTSISAAIRQTQILSLQTARTLCSSPRSSSTRPFSVCRAKRNSARCKTRFLPAHAALNTSLCCFLSFFMRSIRLPGGEFHRYFWLIDSWKFNDQISAGLNNEARALLRGAQISIIWYTLCICSLNVCTNSQKKTNAQQQQSVNIMLHWLGVLYQVWLQQKYLLFEKI